MAGWNASIDLFWVVSCAEKLITLSFCSCDAFLAPFQHWFASAYTFRTLFNNFCTDCPRELSAATTRITHGHYADSPRSIHRLSVSVPAAVRAEQPRNSAEKVTFSVSRTVVPRAELYWENGFWHWLLHFYPVNGGILNIFSTIFVLWWNICFAHT